MLVVFLYAANAGLTDGQLMHHFNPDQSLIQTETAQQLLGGMPRYLVHTFMIIILRILVTLTSDLSPAGQAFHLSREISQHVRNGLTQNFVQIFIVLRLILLTLLIH